MIIKQIEFCSTIVTLIKVPTYFNLYNLFVLDAQKSYFNYHTDILNRLKGSKYSRKNN